MSDEIRAYDAGYKQGVKDEHARVRARVLSELSQLAEDTGEYENFTNPLIDTESGRYEVEFNNSERGLVKVAIYDQGSAEVVAEAIANEATIIERERIVELWKVEMHCHCEEPMLHLLRRIEGE